MPRDDAHQGVDAEATPAGSLAADVAGTEPVSDERERKSDRSDDPNDGPDGSTEEAPADRPAVAASEVTLAEFSAAWPVVVARIRADLGARRHAFVKVAEPLTVEGGVATLTLPAHQHFHLEQLNADEQLRSTLESIAAELLEAEITLRFRSDDDEHPVQETAPSRAPDKDQLDDGPEAEDPADLIADVLGGKIVEE